MPSEALGSSDPQPLCLRCKSVPLSCLPESSQEIAFFECPVCHRQYALKPGRRLTFRWMHPISLVLYGTIFDPTPARRAEGDAKAFATTRTPEQLRLMVAEIRLELAEPTQQVRDILDCQASEEQLREFLRIFADHVERILGQAT